MKSLDASLFRSAPRIALADLPGLGKLTAGIADSLNSGLMAWRPGPWRVTPDGVKEDAPAGANAEGRLVRFESERGSLTALLLLDRAATSAVIEVAMGGTGAEPAFEMSDRPLSKIEHGVLRLVQATLARQLAASLGDVLMRPFSLFDGEPPGIEAGTGLAQLRFVLNVFSYSGEISLFFSRAELERELDMAGAGAAAAAGAMQQRMLQQEVGRSMVSLEVTLGPEMLTLDAIAGLRPGKLIAFSATAGNPVTLWSGGVAAYEATLGRTGDRYAVTITTALA
ncbi:MAG: FliM/FliN family flagellar motor switch protein [Aestuariivirga sp.]|uniref:FliM/FliN family flagellar motor switch protein n=1 Tax=Aestuariivirga sp. TaxID=2650926 RepID=UPI0025B7D3EB|nr:FliM/FliN family flagellar motor switch protein [Aestuariivirga sp.]MCA3561421.1 FliM/FliN family flagellar motor switch protein [Aestuariivirga sp.]